MGRDSKRGKKKRKSKKEKQKLQTLTYQEGVLAYQISNTEHQLEDIKYEIKLLEDQNTLHRERNEALLREQTRLMNGLLESSHERIKKDVECVSKEQVAIKVHQKYSLLQLQQKELSVLQAQIKSKEREIGRVKQDLQHWTEYKDRGVESQRKQISLLKHEIYDMETHFQRMSEMLERNLKSDNVESEVAVNKQLDNQRYLATRNAIAHMDKHSRQEVIDNDWLIAERSLHMQDMEELMREVEELEKENIELMNKLQSYQTEDIMLSRSRVLNQIETGIIDDSSSELEIDLSKINLSNKHGLGLLSKTSILKAIQRRISALTSLQLMQEPEEQLKKGFSSVNLDKHEKFDFHLPAISENQHTVQYPSDDYMRLGPLELKHMSVKGERANLHTPIELTDEEQRLPILRSSDWPVTYNMLVDTLRSSNL